ncbi:MAG: lipoyl(octanoyl) transferase LipB [Pseudomonadota bacterium]
MQQTLMVQHPLIVKHLGTTDFAETWQAMQHFTATRSASTPDELWVTEHLPVYTLGLNRKHVRLPSREDIPLLLTDRGGKITYHGPGQVIIYLLLDLKRNNLNIRTLVSMLEDAVIALLADYGVVATAKAEAPGVYVLDANQQDAKVAALGLRIKNNCCYHGLSLNVNMDLTPFDAIDPCGYVDLKVTQTKNLGITADVQSVSELLLKKLTAHLANGLKHD